MDFKNIEAKYRPIPFWSWNDKLDTDETKRQIDIMYNAGLGGFFMHARGGLKTEYMSKEWFDNISSGIERAKDLNMYPWAYDENGWPSGFGDGKVNGLGKKYQQKWLRYDNQNEGENTICHINGLRFYYEINPFYIDVLLYEATSVFIKEIYSPYYEKYKNDITGFFTDEPQISRDGIPWSETLPEEYKKAYGDDLLNHLEELFVNKGDYKTTRIRFYKLITDLFSKNYMKQIYDWCTERGLSLTGHLSQEETFETQITSNGAVMPHYEYFTIPGMDCLGRGIIYDLTSYQVGSACMQLGKKQILSESYAGCGHNVSFDDMKKICEHQMVHGINLLCQHLQGYSLRGLRKRDWPPALFYQQPWWDKYNVFCDAMARTGKILAEGECQVDTLVIHPMTTAWTFYNENGNDGLEEFYQTFKNIVNELDKKHIQFHLGDETLIERHAKVEGNIFSVGKMSYKRVVLMPDLYLFDTTKKLLSEFQKNGGQILLPEDVEFETNVVDNENIIYTKRIYPDFDVYYFVNHTDNEQTAHFSVSGCRIDAISGDCCSFPADYTFAPGESVLLKCENVNECVVEKKQTELNLSEKWHIAESSLNILTLDYCDYWFDGELQEKMGYVLNITNRAMALKKPVVIKQSYYFNVKDVPDKLYFVCETPDKFEIKVNGNVIDTSLMNDYFIDKSFKKADISQFVTKGENIVDIICNFVQSDVVYKDYEEAFVFETMKNKLTYDMEIEPCYLVGDFGVETGEWTKINYSSFRVNGPFVISKKPSDIYLDNIQKQGFPFFAGNITFEKTFNIDDTNMCINFLKTGINAVSINVNGKDVCDLLWNPLTCDISSYLKKGENKISLTVYNTLRNMLGPHHLAMGESLFVMPSQFYKEKCIWNEKRVYDWDNAYCLVENSLKNTQVQK